MVPDKSNKEWNNIIKGNIMHECSSFSLQMKINTLQRTYKNGLINLQDAVDELYDLCVKYEKIYSADLERIFNS